MKLLNKVIFGLIIFAFLSQVYVPTTKAQSLIEVLPNPATDKFQYVYSATDNSLTEYMSSNSADFAPTGRKYINPVATTKANIVGHTAESAYADLLISFIKTFTDVDGPEEGYLAFQLKGVENIYLLVRLRTKITIGLYTKTDSDFNVLSPIEQEGNVIIREASRSGFNPITLPENVSQYVSAMNGVITGWFQTHHYTAPSHQAGVGAEVKDLVNAETINADITICGKVNGAQSSVPSLVEVTPVTIDPATETTSISSPYLLLQYNLNDKIYVNASLKTGTSNPQVLYLDQNGNFSLNMKGMPAGTYHLFGSQNVFFNSSRKVISYGTVNAQTIIDPLFKEEGTTENYSTEVLELVVDKDGNINDPSYKEPNCKILFTFANSTTSNQDDSICDKIKGRFLVPNIYQGICAIVIAASRFADTAFKYAIELMSKSIGVATNNSYTPNITTSESSSNSSNNTTSSKIIFSTLQNVSSTNALDAASELCTLAKNQNLSPPISDEPCVVQDLKFKDAVNGGTKDSNAGVQIVKGGFSAFLQNGNKPNACSATNLIILDTNCQFSGSSGTINLN